MIGSSMWRISNWLFFLLTDQFLWTDQQGLQQRRELLLNQLSYFVTFTQVHHFSHGRYH